MEKRDELSDPSSCLNRARDDEWLFVLRAKDPTFSASIRWWIGERIRMGLNRHDDPKILEAEQVAAKVEKEILNNLFDKK